MKLRRGEESSLRQEREKQKSNCNICDQCVIGCFACQVIAFTCERNEEQKIEEQVEGSFVDARDASTESG